MATSSDQPAASSNTLAGAPNSGSRKRHIALAALCVAVAALALLGRPALAAEEQLNVESRQQKDNDELSATINYLEKLDQYYSQIARPRFGRSEFKQPMGRPRPLAAAGDQWNRPSSPLLELVRGRLLRSGYGDAFE